MAIAERGPRVGTAEAAAEPRHARAPFGCAGAATRTPVAERASPRRTSASRQRDPLPERWAPWHRGDGPLIGASSIDSCATRRHDER